MPSASGRCPLCGSADGEMVFDLSVAETPFDVPGRIVRCRACPMWFKVLPDAAELPTAYPGEFGEDEVAATYLHGEGARMINRQALEHVRRLGGSGRLLDLGAGQGALVEEAAHLGFDAEGIDHCESNVVRAHQRGLRVALCDAEAIDAEQAFDVVTMMDLIEHVREPLRLLRAAHRALKPGGHLVVYTPNHRAAVVEAAKLLHRLGIHYPVRDIFGRNHVGFFDDRSLPLALEKAGFELESLRYAPYDPARPGQEISPLNLLAVTVLEWVGWPFKRVFRLLAFARRPGPA